MAIKKRITRKVALLLLEDDDYNTGVLETQDAIIEYDALVWNEEIGTIFEKKGKTTKENLEKALEFEAPLNYSFDVYLEITVIINGKRYPFLANSPYSNVIKTISNQTGYGFRYSTGIDIQEPIEGDYELSQEEWEMTANFTKFIKEYRKKYETQEGTPEDQALIEQAEREATAIAYNNWGLEERQLELAGIFAEYQSGGHIDIPFYVVRQSVIDEIIAEYFPYGKLPIILTDVVDEIESLETTVKALQKQIELTKKQSLSSLFATEEETRILENFRNENLYNDLLNLVRSYQQTGLQNLSTYRHGIYETLKTATDCLIVLKGKLENINYVERRKVAVDAAKKTI